MALLDLSLVTKALVELLKAHISNSPAWPFATWNAPKVTGQPPDKLTAGSLGVYLYHAMEEAHLKNQPSIGRDQPPVRFTPMGLSLYYQITAVGIGDDETTTAQEQIYIGGALKALHDYPIIDDETTVLARTAPPPAAPVPVNVLQKAGLDGEGNRFRITMQPVPYEQATTFWNAASLAPRLAIYYQVSVILLEQEKPSILAGRVFRYGVQSFANDAPRLDSSQSVVTVAAPGFPPQQLTAQPAEVPFGGRVAFNGSSLTGDATRLFIQQARWPVPVQVDASWGVSATDDQVTATVQPFTGSTPVAPGLYSAQVRVTRRRLMPDGTTRDFDIASNNTPFSIAARLDPPTFVADVGTLTGYAFAQPDPSQPALLPDAVQLLVGGNVLISVPPPATLNPGEFQVVDIATITFRLPAGTVAGTPVSLRVFVQGAESPTLWFTP
jgi:hypothetical protein